jgi:GNAT superfamily N-acetyltransferase
VTVAGITLRCSLLAGDPVAVRSLARSTGFFSAEEVQIAGDLVDESLRAPAAGYEFLLADGPAGLAGYTCFGRIPGTAASHDLYWIVIAPALQGQGLGRHLLGESEARVRLLGGTRMYADTSSRPQYLATRRFYAACGYTVAAELPDFYRPGDGKVIFVRVLDSAAVALNPPSGKAGPAARG